MPEIIRKPVKLPLPTAIEPNLYGPECDADSRVKRVVDYLREPLTDWGIIPNRKRIAMMLDSVLVVPQEELDKKTKAVGVSGMAAYMYPYSPYHPDSIVIAREPAAVAKPSQLIDIVIEELAHSYHRPLDKPLIRVLPQNSGQSYEQLAKSLGTQNLDNVRCRGYGFLTFLDLYNPADGTKKPFILKGAVGKEEYRASLVKQLFSIKLLQSTQFSGLSRPDGLLNATGALLNRTSQSGVLDGAVSFPFEAQIARANIFMGCLLLGMGDFDGTTIANLINPFLHHLHDDTVFQFGSYIKMFGNPELYNLYTEQMGREEELYDALLK